MSLARLHIDAHERALLQADVPTATVQAVVRCAAVMQSVAVAPEVRVSAPMEG